jgi:hypothetical protein
VTTDMSPLTREFQDLLAPLDAEEERRAIAAALAARKARPEAMVIRGAELAIEKAAGRGERPHRRVRVLLTAPLECVAHEVIVDADGNVVSDRELGPRNLPFLASEIEQARAIAERDEQVAKLLGGCHTVGIGTFAPMLSAAGRDRLVGLHFLDITNPDIPRPVTTAVVNLATGQLVHDSHHGHETRGA